MRGCHIQHSHSERSACPELVEGRNLPAVIPDPIGDPVFTDRCVGPMNIDRLFTHFDHLANAPDAIPRLRRFILDLAVRGKLVPQDPNDEPASELLKRIAAEKKRMVEAGEIRKPRHLNNGEPIPAPFGIPQSWHWVRLDSVGAIIGGGTPSANEATNFAASGQGIPWLTPVDLGGYPRLFISRGARDLSETGLQNSSATLMPKGTVLFTSRAPIGYVAIAENPISTNQGFKSIVPYLSDCSRFVALSMKTFASEINAKAPGTTFKEVSGKIVASVPFPLPPLAEQHRIVAKVDELMVLCDRLEAARMEREATRNRMATASLARLNMLDPDPATFQNHAAFVLDNLSPLTTRPDQIKALRQTILNLAVRGKLVPQNPNDEPASELLKHRKIAVPGVGPFDLPESWAWANVGAVADSRLGKMLDKAKNKGTPRKYLRNINVRWFDFNLSDLLEMRFEDSELPEFTLRGGDVLICEGGEPGRAAVWDNREPDIYFQKAIHRVRFLDFVDSEFFVKALRASADDGRLAEYFTGTGIKHFTGKGLAAYSFPLPPLAEQHRIVAKVDELMALCDRLEASLAMGDETRGRLVEALLHEPLVQGTPVQTRG